MHTVIIKHGVMIGVIVASLAILLTAYIANGSESEDAWLYIMSAWLVIFSGVTSQVHENRKK